MKKIKVMTVFGTRPEALKMAPLALELKKYPEIESSVCVTAQHREMLDQVLEIFKLKPDYDLDIMKERQTLIGITTRILEGLDKVMKEEKPDIVLVHGDTSTSFVGALAAFYNQIRVGHMCHDGQKDGRSGFIYTFSFSQKLFKKGKTILGNHRKTGFDFSPYTGNAVLQIKALSGCDGSLFGQMTII